MDENSLDFTIIHVLDKLLPQMYSWQEFSVNTIINISDEALRKLFPQDMSTTAVTNFFAFTSGGRNDTREHLISSLENYLIHNQFAVIASEKDGKKLILTEKGKKAQELNSFTNYFLWEQQEKKKQKETDEINRKVIEANLLNSKISQYLALLSLMTFATTLVGCIYNFLKIRREHPMFYSTVYPLVLTGALALIATLMLLVIYLLSKHKQELTKP